MNPSPPLAETRLAAEVLVVGDGWTAVAAALAARRRGREVLLALNGVAPAAELTVALEGTAGDVSDPTGAAVVAAIAAAGGVHDGWLDPPTGEMVVDQLLATAGVTVLHLTTPLTVVVREDRAAGVLCGAKDGYFVLAAGAVVDATETGVLTAGAGGSFSGSAGVTARRTVYWQFAGDDLTGLPAEVAGFQLALRPTWPGEACLTLTATAELAELTQTSRLALPGIVAAVRAAVPGLAEAVVSHTGHRLLLLDGPRLNGGQLPGGLIPAGPWASGEGWGDPERLCALGTVAGQRAAAEAVAPALISAPLPAAEVAEAEVVVAGGGTGGALAALAAARLGAETTVVEAGWFLGGIGTGGGIHWYYHGVRGGLQDELDERVRELADILGGVDKVRGFHPEGKKIALQQALAEAGARCVWGATVTDVTLAGERVVGVEYVVPGRRVLLRTAATVDATGDGDVAARAGAEFELGRPGDRLSHAYTQSSGRLREGKIDHWNFDAGYVDATDIVDLTRARRHGIQLYWRPGGRGPEDRLLYLAPLLGLRQARQVVGDYTLTLDDQIQQRTFPDAVAYGACHYDNHAFDYENESDEALFWVWILGQWRHHMRHGVPYRCLLPRGVEGLVLGCRALSVSHDAHMLFRMQRDMQRVGEAAGIAAALAARRGVTPRQIPAADIQAVLAEREGYLPEWPHTLPARPVAELLAELAGEEAKLAAWQLYKLGEAAAPALRGALASDSPDVRWWAAVILAMQSDASGYEVLCETVRARVEQAPTGKAGGPDAGRPAYRSVARWISALPLLGKLGDPRAVELLGEVLRGPVAELDTLIAAVRALGRVGSPAAVPHLRAVLDRDDVTAILGSEHRDARWQLALATAEALAACGAPAPEVIEPWLHDERANVRGLAERLWDALPGRRQTADQAARGEIAVRARRLEGH